MDRIHFLRYTQRHAEQMRQSIPNPSEETRMMWRMEDAHRETLIWLYEQRDTGDDFTVNIVSKVN